MTSLWLDSALLLALTFGGGIAAAANLAAALTTQPQLSGMLTIALCLLASSIASLPLQLYGTFVIERRFGFSHVSVGLFISDQLKSLLLGVLLGAPLLLAVLWLIDHGGQLFWLWSWLLWCAFALALSWAYPTLIAPRFNRFTPLSDAALQDRIQALLQRCGFTSNGLFVMDGSRRSSHGNAYFTGLGNNKRIVFFDTLLDRLDHSQIEAVLAHELGHFHHGHIRSRIALSFAGSLLFLWLFGTLHQHPGFLAGLHTPAGNSGASLMLVMLCAPVMTFWLTPLGSLLSRRHEFQADAYACRHSSTADLIAALTLLYRDNASTLTPDPLHSAFYDSHPPASLRIARLQGNHHEPA
jgi:STE24 endopeptidase